MAYQILSTCGVILLMCWVVVKWYEKEDPHRWVAMVLVSSGIGSIVIGFLAMLHIIWA